MGMTHGQGTGFSNYLDHEKLLTDVILATCDRQIEWHEVYGVSNINNLYWGRTVFRAKFSGLDLDLRREYLVAMPGSALPEGMVGYFLMVNCGDGQITLGDKAAFGYAIDFQDNKSQIENLFTQVYNRARGREV